MATYTYKAKRENAETVTGEVSAQSHEEAVDIIHQLGLLPVTVSVQKDQDLTDLGKPSKIRIKELFIFSRQLASLIQSGIPILRALNIVSDQTQNKYFQKVIRRMAIQVRNGKSFSQALSSYEDIFSPLFVAMVQAGEESGRLQNMLLSVAAHLKRQDEIIAKIRTSLTYPILMGIVGVGTIFFIMVFVIPKMSNLFTSIGDSLPLPTVILLQISTAFSKVGLWVLIGVLAVLGGVQKWAKSQNGKLYIGRAVLGMPYIGEIYLKSELARFCRTLVLVMQSGVSLIRALDVSIPILSNEVIKKRLSLCRINLTAGGSLGESVKESKEIPSMMADLIAIGEESGNLEEVLTEVAESYEQDTEELTKVMTTLFEPLMILFMGLIIGFIVFAMLLPIFQIDALLG